MSEFIFGLTGNIVKVSEIVAIQITSNQDGVDDYFGVQVILSNGHTIPIDVYLPSIAIAQDLIKELVHAMRFSDSWLYALHNHRTKETPVESEEDTFTEPDVPEETNFNEEDDDEFVTF